MSAAKIAIKYCSIRIISTVVIMMIIASSLLYAFFNKSDYLQTEAVVNLAEIITHQEIIRTGPSYIIKPTYTAYKIKRSLSFTVNDKEYTSTNISNSFNNYDDAKKELNKQKVMVYYNKNNPSQTSNLVPQQGNTSVFVSALFLVVFAVGLFLLRKNPIFCGVQIGSDITSVFRFIK